MHLVLVAQGADLRDSSGALEVFSNVTLSNDAAGIAADEQLTQANFDKCVVKNYVEKVAPALGQTNVTIEARPVPSGVPYAYSNTHYSYMEQHNGSPVPGTKDCVGVRRGAVDGSACVIATGAQDVSGVLQAASAAIASRLPG